MWLLYSFFCIPYVYVGYTYVLTFDNTYSRFKAKTVMYSVIRETSGADLEISSKNQLKYYLN